MVYGGLTEENKKEKSEEDLTSWEARIKDGEEGKIPPAALREDPERGKVHED